MVGYTIIFVGAIYIVLAIIHKQFKISKPTQRKLNILVPMIVGPLTGLIVMPIDLSLAVFFAIVGVFAGVICFAMPRGDF
ncbi:MAG: hypothetical protein HN356_11940 [Calditrichaeota bacterium]|jgi:tellurite resistance protein TehA-like permease|nr:hypothetical protein [Calditrichota bacterium]MBT7788298.1 hypothetical protein [Calditrichota bacterium]